MRYRNIIASALAGTTFCALAGPAAAQTSDAAQVETAVQDEAGADSEIVVLGSRIPRVQAEGPAPVTTITSEDILRNGYQSVPDVLRAITQNGGETQSQQSFSGADFTPGAQQVDLRGLGPNHTLVLVNGRRIADFPLPYGGNSNFTDISNIPVGLIERVEVLSGSASAIYGSDAISGVVNFQLKSKPDGTRIDYRAGFTEHGGGSSQRLSLTTGWETGGFHGVVGVELLDQRPLWAYQRRLQDSSADSPTTEYPIARRNFLRTDEDNDYLDPGASVCAALANLNGGTTYYARRPEYGYDIVNDEYVDGRYCGSNEAIGYGTTISERRAASLYGSMGYHLSDNAELFVDVQASYSRLKLFRDVLDWQYVAPDGNEEGTFFNPNMPVDLTYSGDQLDNWYRLFTPEEMGGLDKGMTRNRSFTYNITPGIRGRFGGGKWGYEVTYNHAEYSSKIDFPQVVISKANDFFLGPQIGEENDYPAFDADIARLYKPLTPAEYASITAYSTYRPKTWVNNFSATINTTDLLQLPAGPVGFAAVAEVGDQGYEMNPDPLALTQYYVGLVDSDGEGTRQHWGAGGELRVPVLNFLQLSGAGRYDHYAFAGNGFGKFTYNLGAELRPMKSLLIRGAYGTGFRAPDLHYVFKGPGNTHTGGTDYYLCGQNEEEIGDCGFDDVDFIARHNGNRRLRPETSTSLNAGFVFQPTRNFDFSADYFRVKMRNQVLNMRIDTILRDEAECRPGPNNAPPEADPTTPTCVDAIARVQRYASGALEGEIQSVSINPINIAEETTDGIDIAMHLRVPTAGIGQFSLAASYTHVFGHTIRQYPGDPSIDKLAFDSGYYIPGDKATASLTWDLGRFSTTLNGQRLGKLPNYAEEAYIKASYLFNLSAQVDLTDRMRISGTVNNLFDQNPIKDRTYSAYPYYDISWFDGVGRSFYLQLTYKMGGAKL
ncbi:TonB-dependent receptor [Sphingomonas sp. DG1-23]|uniref:TonB-dependent receptor plug domain-containing protein n=1 Tax=Sphingomonas sp. DG1-23 TaxID=3068316 RepID=UPI0027400608|nr:TonB-dependent receptor [Sphingomonas sp. DG1-23]MDP5277486.1 TonB-dependent receptor [Sphingomonas sp. DG1-23]